MTGTSPQTRNPEHPSLAPLAEPLHVLVVGDFRTPASQVPGVEGESGRSAPRRSNGKELSSTKFASDAWKEVLDAFTEARKHATFAQPDAGALLLPPRPLKFDVSVWRTKVSLLRAYLAQHTQHSPVASIVACPGADAGLFLKATAPLRTPTILTVPTSVEIMQKAAQRSGEGGHISRLIPNNALQAQTMRARIDRLIGDDHSSTQSGGRNRVFIYQRDALDVYARDLERELRKLVHVDSDHVLSNVEELIHSVAPDDTVVSIGYGDGLAKLLEGLQKRDREGEVEFPTIIQSDGVTMAEARRIVGTVVRGDERENGTVLQSDQALRKAARERLLLCLPAHTHSAYARWAYEAVNAAIQSAWRERHHRIARGPMGPRLRSGVRRIIEELSKSDGHFQFNAGENQALGYHIQRFHVGR